MSETTTGVNDEGPYIAFIHPEDTMYRACMERVPLPPGVKLYTGELHDFGVRFIESVRLIESQRVVELVDKPHPVRTFGGRDPKPWLRRRKGRP